MARYREYLKSGHTFEMGLDEAQTVIVHEEIGEGGFGEVWKGEPSQYGQRVCREAY